MAKLQDKFFNRVIEGKLQVAGDDVIAPEAVGSAIAGGNVSNAKPIYFHGLEFRDSAHGCYAYAHILNNDNTLFTLESFIAWIKSITAKVIVACNGLIRTGDSNRQIVCFYKEANSQEINIEYISGSNTAGFLGDVNLADYFTEISDGVNKIN